jgi:urease accessory protein
MLRIETWLGHADVLPEVRAAAATVTLDWNARQRSRLRVTLDDGRDAAVLLPRGVVLRSDDLLMDESGALIAVRAANQAVRVVEAEATALLRAAYHLGNRHVPVQLGDGRLSFESDPVLAAMLSGIGVSSREAIEPFDPEPGAYGGGHRHDHDEVGGHIGEQLSIDAHASAR